MASSVSPPKHDLGSLRIHEGQRKGGKAGKVFGIIAALLGVVVIVTGAVFAFHSQKPVVEVAVAQKAATGRPALLNASGYVTPRRRATIAAKITGRVTGVFFRRRHARARRAACSPLSTIPTRAALSIPPKPIAIPPKPPSPIIEVQLKNAEIELHRAKQLLSRRRAKPGNSDNATMAADSLRAKIALAKAQVAASTSSHCGSAASRGQLHRIRAPFDGIVVSKDAQVGEMVSPISAGGGFTRTGIATIVDMNSNEIEVDVNEAYIARVVPGQHVTAILDAYPDWQIPSRVRTVIPTADRQKATVKVRISFLKSRPAHSSRHGHQSDFLR